MTTPRTAEGRAYVASTLIGKKGVARAIRAIEAEAVAAYKARLVEGVKGLPMTFGQHTCWDDHEGGVDADGKPTLHADGSTCGDRIVGESVARAAVLRLIKEPPA